MFDTVRNNAKLLMGLLFLLIIPSFVLLGVERYNKDGDRGATVAEVDGQSITQAQWDAAHQREVDRIRSSSPNVDAKLLDTPMAKMATLERLVNEEVMRAAARNSLLMTTDARLARQLQQDPVIAGLRSADGKLDLDRYRQLLASQGMTPEMYENQVRQGLSEQQVLQGLDSTSWASLAQTEVALNAFYQRREIQVQTWTPAQWASKVVVNDTALKDFYDKHPERFRTQESVDVEYVVLDATQLAAGIKLPEADLKSYYEQNLQRLSGKEERRASHILIAADKSAAQADKDKALAQAQKLQQELLKTPAKFAELARKFSQDPGSAAKGGDLDYFGRGAMVKPFEDAVFSLKKGEVSAVVQTDFGYHVLMVTDIKQAAAPSFESMRAQLEADLRKQQAQAKFAEAAEVFSNTVYEQSDSLAPVAQKLKLQVQKASALLRQAAPGEKGPLGNAKLLQALFSEDAINKRRNTEAVEVSPNTLVAARVLSHHPAKVQDFAQVQSQVRAQYLQSAAAQMAREQAQAQLKSWQERPDQAQLGTAMVISRQKALDLPEAVVAAALRVDPSKLPQVTGVDLGDQGYAVVRVNKVLPREAQAAQTEQSRQEFEVLWGQAQGQSYLDELKKRLKVKILTKMPL
jgi:peptidyl-prolyl cis-trans isomerase D